LLISPRHWIFKIAPYSIADVHKDFEDTIAFLTLRFLFGHLLDLLQMKSSIDPVHPQLLFYHSKSKNLKTKPRNLTNCETADSNIKTKLLICFHFIALRNFLQLKTITLGAFTNMVVRILNISV
jgi:hypothetical protein